MQAVGRRFDPVQLHLNALPTQGVFCFLASFFRGGQVARRVDFSAFFRRFLSRSVAASRRRYDASRRRVEIKNARRPRGTPGCRFIGFVPAEG